MTDLGRTGAGARDESGFTLVELIVALAVLGILVGIAVPGFLGFRDRSALKAAQANLRNAVPAVESYHADHGTYDATAMTTAALRAYENNLPASLQVVSGSAQSYCLRLTEGGVTVFKSGPTGPLTTTACT